MKGKIFPGNVPWWMFSLRFSLSDFLYYFFTRGFLRRLNIFTISYPPVILLLSLHPPLFLVLGYYRIGLSFVFMRYVWNGAHEKRVWDGVLVDIKIHILKIRPVREIT